MSSVVSIHEQRARRMEAYAAFMRDHCEKMRDLYQRMIQCAAPQSDVDDLHALIEVAEQSIIDAEEMAREDRSFAS